MLDIRLFFAVHVPRVACQPVPTAILFPRWTFAVFPQAVRAGATPAATLIRRGCRCLQLRGMSPELPMLNYHLWTRAGNLPWCFCLYCSFISVSALPAFSSSIHPNSNFQPKYTKAHIGYIAVWRPENSL